MATRLISSPGLIPATSAGLPGATTDIKRFEGTRLEHFDRLPDWIRQAMFLWRFGWLCFTAQLEQLGGCANVRIIDFTEAQSAPRRTAQAMGLLIFDGLAPYERSSRAGKSSKEANVKKAFDVNGYVGILYFAVTALSLFFG